VVDENATGSVNLWSALSSMQHDSPDRPANTEGVANCGNLLFAPLARRLPTAYLLPCSEHGA
jgi:hypothetical protein